MNAQKCWKRTEGALRCSFFFSIECVQIVGKTNGAIPGSPASTMPEGTSTPPQDWHDQIFEVLQNHEVKQVYHVPDAGHGRLIEACQNSNAVQTVTLTTEEEGVALAAGAWLGGQRSVLLMQSSGVGNTINLMGLTKTMRFPLLTLITMRGDYGEFNSWQYPMGQGTPKVLEAMGVLIYSVDNAAEVAATVDAAARAAFNGGQAVAVLLRQKLIGIKDFGKK